MVSEAKSCGKPVVYELDDLLIELPEVHPDYNRYKSVRAAVLAAMVEADAVTCSTPAIGDYVRAFNPNVRVLPNFLNDHLWTLRSPTAATDHPDHSQLILGYLGSHGHGPDFDLVSPVLERILDRYDDRILLRLWGIAPPSGLRGRKNVEWLDLGMVDYAAFASYFSRQECDIFIAPLLDNIFNRGKSPLKFLEYSALGVPGIYSRLPPYELVVNHGENGFLVGSPEEWEDCLVQLIDNPPLRKAMGAAAQATLEENWLLSNNINRWAETWQAIYLGKDSSQKSDLVSRTAQKFLDWQREDALMSARKDRIIQALQATVSEKEVLIEIHKEKLNAVGSSTGWKRLEAIYRVRLGLIPRESRRGSPPQKMGIRGSSWASGSLNPSQHPRFDRENSVLPRRSAWSQK